MSRRNLTRDIEMEQAGWLTPSTAAAIAGKDEVTIRMWARKGLIRSKRVGDGQGHIYIEAKSLNEILGPLAVTVIKASR